LAWIGPTCCPSATSARAVQEHFKPAALPGKVELQQLAEPWQP
jgi:hypothetical protein